MPGLPSGFTRGGGGYLRPSVTVRRSHESWSIAHALWEIDIQRDAIGDAGAVEALLSGQAPVAALDLSNSALAALVRLFIAQGCLTYDGNRTAYAAEEVRYIATAAMGSWYGTYYGHPFWAELNACRLTLTQLFGWMLRTYHLSRSAGVTAARGAVHSENGDARAAFLRNAVEEFSHCEDHYLPCHRRFGLDAAEIKALVPLPSSTAFDHQMAIIAEDDWLAHAIVAFFQEHTAAFRDNAFDLYDRLSLHYGLDQLFEPWKAHVGYDVDHTHADQFESLLRSRRIGRGELAQSLRAAAATIDPLIGTLDELLSIEPSQDLASFRRPLDWRGRQSSQLPDDPIGWAGWLVELWRSDQVPDANLRTAVACALEPCALGPLFVRGLSRAEAHEDVLFLGTALAANLPWPDRRERPDARAISAFLRERSASPAELIWLCCILLELRRAWQSPGCNGRLDSIDRAARRWSAAVHFTPPDRDRLMALAGRFLEICDVAARPVRDRLALDVIAM